MRNLILSNPDSVIKELKHIGVDTNAYSLFINKANYKISKFEGLSCAQANVLKQTALICGADLAIPKTVYYGSKRKKITAILFANFREIEKIKMRLEEQPWMEPISKQLSEILVAKPPPTLKIGNKKLEFNRTYIMGAINITPDSFYTGSRYTTKDTVERIAQEMEEEGADFLDIGAESSRPGAERVDKKEEIKRLKKILPAVIKNTNIPISIDTYKADTASFAIDQGVKLINDISGLSFDKKMAGVIAKNKASLIIMHIKGTPRTMQVNPQYKDLMGEIHYYLRGKIDFATLKGIELNRIIIDPGLGFGKRLEDNYEIINRLNELTSLGRPVLVGHSRKSFIGKPFNISPDQRLEGTLGVEAILIRNGTSIIRVHDVSEAKKVAMLIDKIKE
ncbi:dihydropteroate synthase [candidate division WOR-3 bacterium]|nr:dihydropteroate synthase [candidate division WOR-3 bacterium]